MTATASALARGLRGWHGHHVDPEKLRAAGVDVESHRPWRCC